MGRLHCTQDPVPEAVGGDMQQLNQLGAQQFSALTEVLFHFLTEPKEVERFLAQLSEFATTNQISLGPLRSIVKSLLLVPNGALKKGLTAEQVRADFMTLGLSEEKAVYFSEKWKQNAPTLARWAIGQTLMINQLVDMEWKFGGNQLEPVLGHLDDAGLGGRGSQMTSLGNRDPWSPKIVGSSSCFPVSLSTFSSSFDPWLSVSSLPEKHILLSSSWPPHGSCFTTCKIGLFRVGPQPATYYFSLLCHSDVWEQRTGKSRKYFFTILQLPARDGASQNQHGVFQLISVPTLHLHLAPSLSPPPLSR
ncbi:COMM domain-containing protein 7 isoform X2 [Ovis aries]|uniref:COMM domain-containing protein 7 isoform X2 n=1 Tax=Ovis aries TaxID=9940 RepID=UPI0029528F95|nr:COMM domain-containing protein 7 isoform X2 [Ovis aries]